MELKRLTAQVEDAEVVLERLRHSMDREIDSSMPSSEQDERLLQNMALLEQLKKSQPDMDDKIQRFIDKLAWRDPITNDPRYGPAMQEKILAVAERVASLKEAVVVASDDLTPKVSTALKNKQLRKQEQDAIDAERSKFEQEQARIQAQHVAASRETAKAAQEAAELAAQVEREALAKAAQAMREERARVQAEKERETAEAQRLQDELNQSIPIGLEGLQMALRLLYGHFQQDAAKFRTAKNTLLILLKNICAAPENATYRHINPANEHFHRELGQFPGGLQCLLALGFRPLRQGAGSDKNGVIYVLETWRRTWTSGATGLMD
ncbi:hypothetical protein H310_00634 [Aphanomyces invadans]|uniref:PUB domain-containing protein n=1 Tax=Aphanomyces invadans TaxID=157072 RepID=A0A024UVB4_9STRA|nr:hypothetical protein H310_00634 [Aphanomyces invadans]ETW10294.1 hypothetical protein H310_00634 [Aphanomyces invadans]|eukprot:XP_008861705.1 hypothetical protein H310_00634 [Aphanomyces invadans]